jgi:hypothetical protein
MEVRAVLVIALGALLITVSAYLIPYGFLLQDHWNKMMIGELIPFRVNQTGPFTVQMGGIYVHTMIEELKSGFDLQHYFDLNGIKYPFQVSFRDEKLLISAEIKDKDGNLAAKITNNQWSVNNNPIITHDRNYNSYAFEVIDSDSIPILQVVMTPQNTIFVGGVFYSANGTLLAMLNGTTILNPRNTDIRNYNQTIFQYPSDNHLEELAPNSPFAFRPNQSSLSPIWVIVIGLILLFVGTFITSSGLWARSKKNRSRTRGRPKKPHIRSS